MGCRTVEHEGALMQNKTLQELSKQPPFDILTMAEVKHFATNSCCTSDVGA